MPYTVIRAHHTREIRPHYKSRVVLPPLQRNRQLLNQRATAWMCLSELLAGSRNAAGILPCRWPRLLNPQEDICTPRQALGVFPEQRIRLEIVGCIPKTPTLPHLAPTWTTPGTNRAAAYSGIIKSLSQVRWFGAIKKAKKRTSLRSLRSTLTLPDIPGRSSLTPLHVGNIAILPASQSSHLPS